MESLYLFIILTALIAYFSFSLLIIAVKFIAGELSAGWLDRFLLFLFSPLILIMRDLNSLYRHFMFFWRRK